VLRSLKKKLRRYGGNKMNKTALGILALFVTGLVLVGMVTAFQGAPNREGHKFNGEFKEKFEEFREIHDQLRVAMENGDYNEWLSIIEENDLPMREKITSVINEDNFHLLKELHDAREAGDIDRVMEIKEDLGIGPGRPPMGQGHGRCQGKGFGGRMRGGF